MDTRKWIEVILMPLAVALVGILGTYLVTEQQDRTSATLANSDRQIKILEIFADKVTSSDDKERLLAINLLGALDNELAEKLAQAVVDSEPGQTQVKQAAMRLAALAKARQAHIPIVYLHISSDALTQEAKEVETSLSALGWHVEGVESLQHKGLSHSELRYFHAEEKQQAEAAVKQLAEKGIKLSLRFVPGDKRTAEVGASHFEVWLIE
ncbi:hypothetical protein P2G88_18365 [Aliiglaciecola sp. CAU 1673]|uniref:hypothetical protein n=1 Tax=Aliiglaciecola sp. CAU 1673 TaxID=3032595 RepID=UPI0023DA1FEB|nr:hypothetical protein [Aliiglaciecola sp. CAU 1673]MDF2180224.1 hypothetical protein [Aliiglaciecola sp. CAU 1673]